MTSAGKRRTTTRASNNAAHPNFMTVQNWTLMFVRSIRSQVASRIDAKVAAYLIPS